MVGKGFGCSFWCEVGGEEPDREKNMKVVNMNPPITLKKYNGKMSKKLDLYNLNS